MINFVLKTFLKKLNSISLSADERAILRRDFLTRTGLPDLEEQPSLRSSFVLVSPKNRMGGEVVGRLSFELHLVEGNFDGEEQNIDDNMNVRTFENDVMVKFKLNVLGGDKINKRAVTPETFVIMKVARQNKVEKVVDA